MVVIFDKLHQLRALNVSFENACSRFIYFTNLTNLIMHSHLSMYMISDINVVLFHKLTESGLYIHATYLVATVLRLSEGLVVVEYRRLPLCSRAC